MSLGTRWRIQQTSTQARPKFIQQKELHYSLPQLKVALGTGIASHQHLSCSVVQSITMVEKLHQLQHSSVYNSKKMILKKIYLSWWTTQSLARVFYMFICSYILTYSLQVIFFLSMIICSYVFIDSFLADKDFFFVFLCSCVFIDFLYLSLFQPVITSRIYALH